MEETRLWTRNFVLNMMINFMVSINFSLLLVIIYDYSMGTLGASSGAAGVASGIFVIGGLAARLIFGNELERLGYRRVLIFGMVLSLIMSLTYFVVNTVPLLLSIRFLHGVGFGICTTVSVTVVAKLIPLERRGEGIGYFGLSQTLATAVGPFMAITLSRYGSYSTIFLVCSLSCALAMLAIPFISFPPILPKLSQEPGEIRRKSPLEFSVLPAALIAMLTIFCYSNVISYMEVYSQSLNLIHAAGFFFPVYAMAMFISRPMAGRLFDSRGANPVLYTTAFISAAGLLLLGLTNSGFTLLLTAAVLGMGIGGVQSAALTLAIKLSPPARLGQGNATFMIFNDIGMGIGASIGGLLIPYSGFRGLYFSLVGVMLLALITYYFSYGRTSEKKGSSAPM